MKSLIATNICLIMIFVTIGQVLASSDFEPFPTTPQPAVNYPVDAQSIAGYWRSVSGGEMIMEIIEYTTGSDPSDVIDPGEGYTTTPIGSYLYERNRKVLTLLFSSIED